MRSFLIFISVVAVVLAADEDTCLKGLKRCKDANIYAIDRLFNSGDMSKLEEGCEIYSSALTCLDTIACPDTDLVNSARDSLRSDLKDEVDGGCLPDGSVDECVDAMRECAMDLAEADAFLSEKTSQACAEVQIYDKCVEQAKAMCSSNAISEMMGEIFPLNTKAKTAGCDPDCLETMSACTFDFDHTDEEYCKSYEASKQCLAKAKDEFKCSAAQSQNYLDEAVKHRGAKYLKKCRNGAIASVSTPIFLIASSIVAALVVKINK